MPADPPADSQRAPSGDQVTAPHRSRGRSAPAPGALPASARPGSHPAV